MLKKAKDEFFQSECNWLCEKEEKEKERQAMLKEKEKNRELKLERLKFESEWERLERKANLELKKMDFGERKM